VVYDAARQVFYVSNYYNGVPGDDPDGNEFLSKVKSSGEIEELDWITGLNRPTGQCIHNDRLLVVERGGLVEIDLPAGKIVARHQLPAAVFPNDVAIDAAGRAYISDSNQGVIYRLQDDKAEIWFTSVYLMNPNGLCIRAGRLLVGDSGDGCVKEIDLASQEIQTIAYLGAGSIIDGLTCDRQNNLLVTDWNGRLLQITPDGKQTELLNMTVPQYNCADIAYLADQQLVVIPTFTDNRLLAYELK
jgi:sugar lactone lactonase YvrE